MRIPEFLALRRQPFFSFELIPPIRGGGMAQVHEVLEALMPFHPAWVDVTNHAADSWFEEGEDGAWRRHIYRKRPGTLGLCAALRYRYGVETVPHLLCVGFTREETEDALIELSYLDIHNVLAIRGDVPDWHQVRPGPRNAYAVDLVRQVREVNAGRYLHELAERQPGRFAVGVAGYPEKHVESPNLSFDLEKLKEKQDAGAEWVVSQMGFDAGRWADYVARCRAAGIHAPILPGLKVVSRLHQVNSLPRHFHVDLPEELVHDLLQARGPAEREEAGVRHATRLGRALLEAGAPGLHFFVTQDAPLVVRVLQALNL
ncbi:MAG: methylenetetrahydrofolate reductase [Candidatus Delongbacteria bacterium]